MTPKSQKGLTFTDKHALISFFDDLDNEVAEIGTVVGFIVVVRRAAFCRE